jgi:GT2 family glycosyltransferase
VQVGRDAPAPPVSTPPFEPFGVQATAAIYRRTALERVAFERARPFDERLESWYEDVDLAGRLRAAGFRARAVPAARALHRGSATGATMPWRRRRLLARNRILVVARLTGRRFPALLPRLALRDLIDGVRVSRAEPEPSRRSARVARRRVRLPGFGRAGRRSSPPKSSSGFRSPCR